MRHDFTSDDVVVTYDDEVCIHALESSHVNGAATIGPTSDIRVSGLGDESLPGLRFPIDLGPLGKHDLYTYFWRHSNVVALLASSNIIEDFDAQSTLKLAYQIDQRMTR